jgi:hypothetical protein
MYLLVSQDGQTEPAKTVTFSNCNDFYFQRFDDVVVIQVFI